jgi:hypothetical protein
MGVNWDPRRFLPPYSNSFIEELVASTAQSYPGREFRLALPQPPALDSLAGETFTR